MYGLLSYSILSTKKYLNRGCIENLLAEYEFLKKLLYVGLPVLIIVMLLFLSTYQPENPNFIFALFPGLLSTVGGALLRFTFNVTKKDFRFYYAKACFQLLSEKTDEAERMNLLIRALKSYNKYLERILKLQISSIDNICSRIISDTLLNKQEFTHGMFCLIFLLFYRNPELL